MTKSRKKVANKKIKGDYYENKCMTGTSITAFVKSKEIVPCLRYKHNTVVDDEHYITTFLLDDGTEFTSYSKVVYCNVIEGRSFEIPVRFSTLPSGKQVIYA